MDLRQLGVPFEKKFTQFSEENIKEISETYHNWQTENTAYQDVPEFCYSAKLAEIESKDFSLVPSKYIEFFNRDENIDYDAKMNYSHTILVQKVGNNYPKSIQRLINQ